MSVVQFGLDATRFGVQVAKLRAAMRVEAANVLYGFAQTTMQEAQTDIVQRYSNHGNADPSGPNPGELRDSGYVELPVVDRWGTIMVEAGFGKTGPASFYALHVHEGHYLVAWGVPTAEFIPPTKFWETPLLARVSDFEHTTGFEIGTIINTSWRGY